MGFFLPMTSAVSAIGFYVFGYEYGPLIMVIVYISVVPLGYFLFRKLGLTAIISFLMALFFISAPLGIWFSKSTYSEAIWQVQLLVVSTLSYIISNKENIKISDYISLCLLMIVVPFTRGEASLLYGIIIFLSLYHLWKFNNLKSALLIASSSFVLAASIQYTLSIRAHYLLKWQYARIIPDITQSQLMSILYGATFFIFVMILFLYKFKKFFTRINFPMIVTILSIVAKVLIAYIYYIKKGAIAHTLLFTNALGFTNFLIMNEFGFAYDNFGFLITSLIAIGLILLYFKAMKGDRASLILVVMYTIFTLPFVMQSVNAKDIHEIFMYWGRYYFSIIMFIHIFALGLVVKLIYDNLFKVFKEDKYRYIALFTIVSIVVFISMDSRLYKIVTNEAYLKNSQKLMPWVSKRVGHEPLAIVYDGEIKYELHHDRSYDAHILVYRTFPVAKINVKSYQKVERSKLTPFLKYTPDISKDKFLLCLSKEKCDLENDILSYVDTLRLPISWREHYGIHPEDKKIHHNNLVQSKKNSFELYATLYKINPKFNFNHEIAFNKSSSLALSLLRKGWQDIIDSGALSTGNQASITLPIADINTKYQLTLKYAILNATKQSPKKIKFLVNGKVIKESIVNNNFTKIETFELPNKEFLLDKKSIEINIKSWDMKLDRASEVRMLLRSLILKKSLF